MSSNTISHKASRSIKAFAVAVAAVLALSACTGASPDTTGVERAEGVQSVREAILADHDLSGLDAREIINLLDSAPKAERPDHLIASIRPHELILTDANQREATLPMPEDQFYVSLAPYVDQTHDCYFHSLTTCTGEIQNEEVQMLVTDSDSGEVLIDETRTSFDNGFVGVWLPRDVDVTVEVSYQGLSAMTELSTRSDDDATCVTTMQLA